MFSSKILWGHNSLLLASLEKLCMSFNFCSCLDVLQLYTHDEQGFFGWIIVSLSSYWSNALILVVGRFVCEEILDGMRVCNLGSAWIDLFVLIYWYNHSWDCLREFMETIYDMFTSCFSAYFHKLCKIVYEQFVVYMISIYDISASLSCLSKQGLSSKMGVMSRRVVPACGNLCCVCPSLRASSRQPVKRYKKLLAEIFPRNQVRFSSYLGHFVWHISYIWKVYVGTCLSCQLT
jgi:hypothetical protein